METREEYGIYDDPGRRARKKKRRTKSKRQTFVAVLFAVVFFYALFSIGRTQWALYQTNQEVQALQEELNRLQEEQEELLEMKEYVGSQEYIEYKARKELGLIKEGESLIVLNKEAATEDEE